MIAFKQVYMRWRSSGIALVTCAAGHGDQSPV
jgi:hypothetical protein